VHGFNIGNKGGPDSVELAPDRCGIIDGDEGFVFQLERRRLSTRELPDLQSIDRERIAARQPELLVGPMIRPELADRLLRVEPRTGEESANDEQPG
jgi:hypothetical protein